jgi:hypothetical protein
MRRFTVHRLSLTDWEVGRLIELMNEQPDGQQSKDRELSMKLYTAYYAVQRKRKVEIIEAKEGPP